MGGHFSRQTATMKDYAAPAETMEHLRSPVPFPDLSVANIVVIYILTPSISTVRRLVNTIHQISISRHVLHR